MGKLKHAIEIAAEALEPFAAVMGWSAHLERQCGLTADDFRRAGQAYAAIKTEEPTGKCYVCGAPAFDYEDDADAPLAVCSVHAARTEGRGEGRDELEDGNRQAEAELFEAILKWLGERDLYDRRDYFHEGITADDIIEQLDAHEAALASPIREPEISRVSRDAAKRSSERLNAFVSDAMKRGVDAARSVRERCTLEECPPGLFVADAYNTLGMKTEYHTDKGAVEAYIVESGEFFWGDNPQTVERQRAQIVRPISYADAILNLAPVAKGASQDAELSDEFDRPGRLSDATRHSAEGTADPALSGTRGVVTPVGGRGEEGSSQSQPGVSAVQQPASSSAQHSDGGQD